MRALNIITLVLLIVGGLNWGLVGLTNIDIVTAILGIGPEHTDTASGAARLVYLLVGLSAVYQIVPLFRSFFQDHLAYQR